MAQLREHLVEAAVKNTNYSTHNVASLASLRFCILGELSYSLYFRNTFA
jgi:hypothetical protein